MCLGLLVFPTSSRLAPKLEIVYLDCKEHTLRFFPLG